MSVVLCESCKQELRQSAIFFCDVETNCSNAVDRIALRPSGTMKCATNPTGRIELRKLKFMNTKKAMAYLTLKGGLESLGLAEKSKEMMRSTPL